MQKTWINIVRLTLLILTAQGFLSMPPASSWSTSSRCGNRLGLSGGSQHPDTSENSRTIVDTSTLVLLEHVNLNVPSQEYILPFYFDILGCGMDPRKVENLQPDAPKKTLWANCGASQFHLPYGDTAQCIPGQIGLYYDSLEQLKDRLEALSLQPNDQAACIQEWQVVGGSETGQGRQAIRIQDHYGNIFVCRSNALSDRQAEEWKQPILLSRDGSDDTISQRYAVDRTDCRGIDYVEFQCPPNTADRIALFYETIFDATTSVLPQPDETALSIAVIGFGNIDAQGRADQSLLFRESRQPLPEYDGHHIAMYVGETGADFERAFAHAQTAGIVWVNPRFCDKTTDLQGARKWKQFRFKDIIDMETGDPIFELEHEMRSIQHESWPGPKL